MAFQMSGPMLEMCILAVLLREDSYGYALTQSVASRLGLSESTLYPVLRRLKKQGFLDVYDVNHDGRNRRYYSITKSGSSYLNELLTDWTDFIRNVSALIQEMPDQLPQLPEHDGKNESTIAERNDADD